MVVSILMAGPIGEEGGKIGVRRYEIIAPKSMLPNLNPLPSYHFGETTTRTKATWPDFNKTAYGCTVDDFTKFAMSVFSTCLPFHC